MKKLITTLAAAGALASTVATSQAQIVANGGPLTPVTSPAVTGGSSIGSQSPTFSDPTLTQVGSLSSTVLTGDGAFGYTGYTFVYQVSETGSTTVNTISLDGYAAMASVYVAIVPSSGAGVPDFAQLSGGVLTIDLYPNTPTGGSSDQIYVYTSANTFGVNGATADDGVSANTTDLAPAAVPEASTVMAGALMILPLGFGAFRALRKERIA